jgi:hypothetical protein
MYTYMFLIVLFVMGVHFVLRAFGVLLSAWSLDAHGPPSIFDDEDDSFFMVHS